MEALVYKGLERRGLAGLETAGAYEMAAGVLVEASRVLILTGFPIRGARLGETDGPPGALSVAQALEQLGKVTAFATDAYNAPLLELGMTQFGLKSQLYVFAPGVERAALNKSYETFRPDAVISIERPGRARDGACYSMRGEAISDLAPILDPFFELAKAAGIPTLAIGDGGNEIGMGNLKDVIVHQVANGEKIAATTAADHLMLAAVSNWGAHALVGTMSLMSGRDLLHSAKDESALIHGMIRLGAVDGATKLAEATVDGYSLEDNLQVLDDLKVMIAKALENE
jgi:hypothetical protein